MGGNESFKTFELDEPMTLVTNGLMGVIILMGLLACCTSFTMHKIPACITVLLLFVFIIPLCIIAAALFVPGKYGEKFVTEGCAHMNANNV